MDLLYEEVLIRRVLCVRPVDGFECRSGRKSQKRQTQKEAERSRKKAFVIEEAATQQARITTHRLPTITSMPYTDRGGHNHRLRESRLNITGLCN